MNAVESAANAVTANARGLAKMSVRDTTGSVRDERELTISSNKGSAASPV